MTTQVHYEKDITVTNGAGTLVGAQHGHDQLVHTDGVHAHPHGSEYAHAHGHADVHGHVNVDGSHHQEVHTIDTIIGGSSQHHNGGVGFVSGSHIDGAIIETIYEKPIVITHQEQTIYKEKYEGQIIERDELATSVVTHTNAAIVKEIHQDIIHEHHKDVIVEHHKDILHEHHQDVIHEHHQPVIIEKHIHEHHQPIIHEKHTTLIEEVHVPIVHETDTYRTDQEVRHDVITEQFDKAVITEVHERPIIHEVVEKTIIETDGHAHLHQEGHAHLHGEKHAHAHNGEAHLHGHTDVHTTGGVHVGGGAHSTTHEVVSEKHGVHGDTHVHETVVQDGHLLEDEEWVVDEHGHQKKQKRGFFGHLKDKITGHSHQ